MHSLHYLRERFKELINQKLPAEYREPVHFNHCFNRIILDWLFKDCWYNHLQKNKTAICQLNEQQLNNAINRMQLRLNNKALLMKDNNASLKYRKVYRLTISD